ncbi:MAG: hypothetical protein ABSF63_06700 [Candidatus Bathyarchaeia archaeon]
MEQDKGKTGAVLLVVDGNSVRNYSHHLSRVYGSSEHVSIQHFVVDGVRKEMYLIADPTYGMVA